MERKRGSLEDKLIDEVAEWCLWNYATVREYVRLTRPVGRSLTITQGEPVPAGQSQQRE